MMNNLLIVFYVLVPIVSSLPILVQNQVSSVGDSVHLNCSLSSDFASSYQCPKVCYWTSPDNITCSSVNPDTCLLGIKVKLDKNICKCELRIENANKLHQGDWICSFNEIIEDQNETSINKQNSNETFKYPVANNSSIGESLNVKEVDNMIYLNTVVEEQRRSIFYVIFFILAILAKILLVVVIIFSIFVAFCKDGRRPALTLYPLPSIRRSRRHKGERSKENIQTDLKIFSGRTCELINQP